MTLVMFGEDLSSNFVEMDRYEERLVIGLPGRHKVTRTKVLVFYWLLQLIWQILGMDEAS